MTIDREILDYISRPEYKPAKPQSLARKLGVIMIARAKGQHFLVYNGIDDLVLDAVPRPRANPPPSGGKSG